MCEGNFIKDKCNFTLMIILSILMTVSLDSVCVLLGENNFLRGHHWDLKG